MNKLSYKVFFTPLAQADDNIYADEVDVTDRVLVSGVGDIRSSIDASDYSIGVFTFSDLELKGLNAEGYFNETDSRSIFPSTRDRCKVRVVFRQNEFTRNSEGTILTDSETDTITFRGLINEEATRIDFVESTIRFKVLSSDSVLRTTRVSAGVVNDGDLFSEAIFAILNTPRITSVLGLDVSDINPDIDLTVDDGSYFDDKSVKDALNQLLFASNSVLLIEDQAIVVRSRAQDPDSEPLQLFGQYDIQKRENIIQIKDYNPGRHRTFTQVVVNGTQSTNATFAAAYGLRTKTYELPFITDAGKAEEIADRVVDEFKVPKTELNVTVATTLVTGLRLLDQVSVSYPLRLEPPEGKFLPIYNVTVYGSADEPYPLQFGSVAITPEMGFKVIEITHNAETFTSVLKLRQFGTSLDDGFFNTPTNNKYDFAVYDLAKYGSPNDDPVENYNPSVYGAGQYDATLYE